MATERNPKGEPHPTIPHLYRKPQPRTAASDFYPYLPSNEQHRAREDKKERKALAKKREGR
jgi:hypothetical protein